MDEKTYNKDFVLYSLGMNIEELEKYLDPAYGQFPRSSGPHSPARQGHIKRPVLRLTGQKFLHPANQCY